MLQLPAKSYLEVQTVHSFPWKIFIFALYLSEILDNKKP